MKEKTLVRICLVSVFIGILIMFFSNRLIGPKEVKLSEISKDSNYVKIKGNVSEVHESNSGTLFLKLTDGTGCIDVVVFKDSIENVSIDSGEFIEVIGKPQEYKGKIEIIASQIIK